MHGLLLMIELYGRSLADPRRIEWRRVGIQGWAEALRNARIRDSVTSGLATVRAAIVRLIERGQRAGEMRADVDPQAAARIMIATFQGLVLQASWGEAIDLSAVRPADAPDDRRRLPHRRRPRQPLTPPSRRSNFHGHDADPAVCRASCRAGRQPGPRSAPPRATAAAVADGRSRRSTG